MGPIALFDKSFIQSLSIDEAVWFDHFFLCNIAPPFLIETLADLEKEVRAGRTPEDEVRIIAEKSPENGVPGINSFHRNSYIASLLGHDVPMTGQVLISNGKRVKVDGKSSTLVEQTPEAEAFQRWQKSEFHELERGVAKKWRNALEQRPNVEGAMRLIAQMKLKIDSCANLGDVKRVVDAAVEGGAPTIKLLELSFVLQPVGGYADSVRERLIEERYKPLRWFAPYAALVLSVDLVFYIGIHRGFIAADRPSNKTDFSYLYYLPFCMLFVSSDKLHRTAAPLFLRPDQKFVWGPDLKAALSEINAYFLQLPESEREKGVYAIADKPPKESGTLVANLWKEFLKPGIMEKKSKPVGGENPTPEEKELIAHLNDFVRKARAAPAEAHSGEEPGSLLIQRKVRSKRGSWRIVSKTIADSEPEDV
ncbi:MAG: hypothetical protein HY077_16050 [Elusimicrobia bacterium]|nr:hypothetical protein [Elusimicrobiota bacterium]